jgi:hypothetical protein
MMVADFLRVPPAAVAFRAVGGSPSLFVAQSLIAGETDAGRPQLPLPLEVY